MGRTSNYKYVVYESASCRFRAYDKLNEAIDSTINNNILAKLNLFFIYIHDARGDGKREKFMTKYCYTDGTTTIYYEDRNYE